jgi:hypothetical protein
MTTLPLLTEDHLQDELTWYQPGSLVNLSPLRENALHLVMSVVYGEKSPELWAKQSQSGSWERTSQDSLALNLDDISGEWSMTWPHWGIASDGQCSQLHLPARFIAVDESLLLPTPVASVSQSRQWNAPRRKASGVFTRQSGAKIGSELNWELRKWHLQNGGEEDYLMPNPSFVERIMGFPQNWTNLD